MQTSHRPTGEQDTASMEPSSGHTSCHFRILDELPEYPVEMPPAVQEAAMVLVRGIARLTPKNKQTNKVSLVQIWTTTGRRRKDKMVWGTLPGGVQRARENLLRDVMKAFP